MAKSQFIGTWQDDLTTRQGYDEFMDAVGLQGAKEKYKDASSKISYNVNGDSWCVTASSSAFPGAEKTYNFTAGKPFEDKGMDGSDVKATVNVINDCEIEEVMENNSEDGKWRTYTVKRKVCGDVMEVSMSCCGKTMTDKMKRV